MLQTT